MTRAEAEQRAQQLQAEQPEPATHRYFPRRSGEGDWQVAKVEVPQHLRRQPLTPTIDASPRPSPADDPRSGHEKRAPGFPGGIG